MLILRTSLKANITHIMMVYRKSPERARGENLKLNSVKLSNPKPGAALVVCGENG